MASDDSPADADPPVPAPSVLPAAQRARIFLYFGGLTVILSLADPAGGLIDVPLSFYLKNKLHLTAHETAMFRAVAAAPLYLSFLFGLARDRWNIFGRRDRGMMLLFGGLGAALYLGFAFAPMNYQTLLLAIALLTACSLFVDAAQNGLASVLGQQHAMTGQMSAVWSFFGSIPVIGALVLGGQFSDWLERQDGDTGARWLFLVGAAATALGACYALLKPRSVFDNMRDERLEPGHPLRDLKRLARHKPVYAAMAIWLLWNFAPGSNTPLQYHLQNALHADDSVWGFWNAIFAAAFLPAFALYGFLCMRVSLGKLLWWGTIVAVPQFIPLLFVDSQTTALIAAVPMGLLGGIATAAYLDLLIRVCPPALQGTTMMLSTGVYYVSSRGGDILGARLYEKFGGFGVCVAMITVAYALILPVLWTIPADLVALRDNEVAPRNGPST